MMENLSFLSIYKVIFALELNLALWISCRQLQHRTHYIPRLLLSAAAMLALAWFIPVAGYNALFISLLFLLLFCAEMLLVRFCVQEPMTNIFFCSVLAYTMQHMAYETWNFIVTVTGLGNYGDAYAADFAFSRLSIFELFFYLFSYALIYFACWAVISYYINAEEKLDIGSGGRKLFIAFIVVAVDVVLNSVMLYGVGDTVLPITVQLVIYCQSMLCCVLAIGILFSLQKQHVAAEETEEVRRLWQLDRALYERFRESVDVINIKCHDLKHQIRQLRGTGSTVSSESLAVIEEAVSIYGSRYDTGCEILDTILAERSLLCEARQIRLICMADGQALNGFSPDCLCTIFGNAISNAMEAVEKVADPERKVVHLSVTRTRGFVNIHVDNPFAEELIVREGLPVTSKGDTDYHGFGMRSMRLMAEKMGGGLSFHAEEQIFCLDICLPLPA